MLNKGQGATMGTYDTFLLAFDMDNRVDEARSLWNMVFKVQTAWDMGCHTAVCLLDFKCKNFSHGIRLLHGLKIRPRDLILNTHIACNTVV
ncbi:pentatricopeptide repeat-containing protein chloroplastic-like isoform X1 [Gossypium australe]|uniref:Pentatricopeptide repeat-containing protein chloroplastic-like isoform X1 n=1 Tax=Gossypium australe TaxID=47621 RepID=A0A5B6WKM6_9ROSI|nr:pentatricopeptide repeat-containing protein chloroplastic-like isoform X1 [Gossypium australe]